jgi:hypothetical protein
MSLEARRARRREQKKRWRLAHPDEWRAKRRAMAQRWRARHPERQKEKQREQYHRHKDKRVAYSKEYSLQHPEWAKINSALSGSRERARRAGVPHTLTKDNVLPIPERCPILNIPLDARDLAHTPSLDRRVPAAGYVPENVAWISHRANTIKSFGTAAEHRAVADWLDPR